MSDGERWIAAQNIENFQKKLEQEHDETRRRVLHDLIQQEREKLGKFDDQKLR